MSELVTAARPYARAVFELAQSENTIDKWSENLGFMTVIVSDSDMTALLDNPKLSKQETGDLLASVCGDDIDGHATNLIKLLAENDRLTLIPEISALFEHFRASGAGMIEAEVVSAQEISDEQQAKIADSLKKRLGQEVKLTTRIDESLLGGAIIRAGDLVIDGSLKGRLAKITTAMSR